MQYYYTIMVGSGAHNINVVVPQVRPSSSGVKHGQLMVICTIVQVWTLDNRTRCWSHIVWAVSRPNYYNLKILTSGPDTYRET